MSRRVLFIVVSSGIIGLIGVICLFLGFLAGTVSIIVILLVINISMNSLLLSLIRKQLATNTRRIETRVAQYSSESAKSVGRSKDSKKESFDKKAIESIIRLELRRQLKEFAKDNEARSAIYTARHDALLYKMHILEDQFSLFLEQLQQGEVTGLRQPGRD